MKKLLLCLLFNASFAIADTAGFTYQNAPVNPACVAMFNASAADSPYISAINLNTCQHSNAAYQKTLTTTDGDYYFYNNDKDDAEGSYHYKVIGKTANGIFVVSTRASGGGTYVGSSLLLIQLLNNNQYVFDGSATPKINPFVEMKLIGYINGGDRCVGDFIDVKLAGDQLTIKQHNGANAVDCDLTKTYSIDLKNLAF